MSSVLTGIPNQAIDVSITPPPVSAQNPWNGRRFVSNIGIICSRIPSQIKLLYQMKMQYDFLFRSSFPQHFYYEPDYESHNNTTRYYLKIY